MEALTLNELKDLCVSRGFKKSGTKAELVERIKIGDKIVAKGGHKKAVPSVSKAKTATESTVVAAPPRPPDCRCVPPLAAMLLTVKKDGANCGRKFYKCQKCGFFEWCDEVIAPVMKKEKVKREAHGPDVAAKKQRVVNDTVTPADKSSGSFFYAIKRGHVTGVVLTWKECERSVKGFAGAEFKKFKSRADAEEFCQDGGQQNNTNKTNTNALRASGHNSDEYNAQEYDFDEDDIDDIFMAPTQVYASNSLDY